MATWLDVLQLALALGAGWLGWVLLRLAHMTQRPPRPSAPAGARVAPGTLSVVKAQAVDSDPYHK